MGMTLTAGDRRKVLYMWLLLQTALITAWTP